MVLIVGVIVGGIALFIKLQDYFYDLKDKRKYKKALKPGIIMLFMN